MDGNNVRTGAEAVSEESPANIPAVLGRSTRVR